MAAEQRKSSDNSDSNGSSIHSKLDGQESLSHTTDPSKMFSPSKSKDHWTHSAYNASASFVPLLTTEILQWLDPQPTDAILDLGCGDGVLTVKIANMCSSIDGFDASANLLESAKKSYGTVSNVTWSMVDCRYLETSTEIEKGRYNKVFSNAALHWILRDLSTRTSVLRGTYKALRPGGEFVFEMGGAGNVEGVHAALLAALKHQGVSIEEAREACPWYFPSENLMKNMLEEVGFTVQKLKAEYRPTRLMTGKAGGLEGWVRLMGAQFLEVLPTEEKKEAVVKEVCDVLKTVITHEEDGGMWLGYVRLKVLAQK